MENDQQQLIDKLMTYYSCLTESTLLNVIENFLQNMSDEELTQRIIDEGIDDE